MLATVPRVLTNALLSAVDVIVARLLHVRKWHVLSAMSRLELIGYSHSSALLLSVAHDLYGVWYMVFGCVTRARFAAHLRAVSLHTRFLSCPVFGVRWFV